MVDSKHWLVCVDLTKMDPALIGYTSFLTSITKPEKITFLHVIESGPDTLEIIDQFPEINTKEEFTDLLRDEINQNIDDHFDHSDVETTVEIVEGKPTNTIIDIVTSSEPDLLLMGKKAGYAGEGVIPKRILKYVATSILFVPENSGHSLENILVPTDFSEQSAKCVKTASILLEKGAKSVTAQHIYEYRAQFFPYMLSDDDKIKVDKEVRKKKESFVRDYSISERVNFRFTLHNKGKIANTVYEEMINTQADLIIVSSKVKKFPALIRTDFTDKMVDYNFGVPLLILKNRQKYQKFLKSLFDE
jgi:nucleotide-binding universal stress UspA family protein